ncbi:hypothetical protein F8M41_013776 [Gigaspora margarita]|uniref:Uncharacterized protein n=1 Tax=Gigaspora margarita TaxID=4874 RepID=A0A8H4EUQ4_GIGMA|nr:hypothetical protein F8M41_013776 [Gigaspora margarita]
MLSLKICLASHDHQSWMGSVFHKSSTPSVIYWKGSLRGWIYWLNSNFHYYNFRLSHSEVLVDYSGEDPTKHNDNDDCPNKSLVNLTIAFFLGIMVMVLVGVLFISSIIIRRSYQAIPNPM